MDSATIPSGDGMSVAALVAETIIVSFVFENGVLRQVQDALESVTDSVLYTSVVSTFVPKREDIFLVSD